MSCKIKTERIFGIALKLDLQNKKIHIKISNHYINIYNKLWHVMSDFKKILKTIYKM